VFYIITYWIHIAYRNRCYDTLYTSCCRLCYIKLSGFNCVEIREFCCIIIPYKWNDIMLFESNALSSVNSVALCSRNDNNFNMFFFLCFVYIYIYFLFLVLCYLAIFWLKFQNIPKITYFVIINNLYII